jgi:hypothetical protein
MDIQEIFFHQLIFTQVCILMVLFGFLEIKVLEKNLYKFVV